MFPTPRILLQLEALSIFIVSLLFYRHYQAGWSLFAILFLAPDLFMLGYLLNARVGPAFYNSVHNLAAPAILLAVAFLTAKPGLLPFVFIWTAHIGMDRLLGYGLKYPSGFKDTHLQRV